MLSGFSDVSCSDLQKMLNTGQSLLQMLVIFLLLSILRISKRFC